MHKNKYIQQLENIKLVIGNGFDLECKLKSSYKHFFKEQSSRYTKIIELYDNFCEVFDPFYQECISIKDFIDTNKYIKTINVWDAFFAINKYTNNDLENKKWTDIETCIKSSLQDSSENTDVSWPYIFNLFTKTTVIRKELTNFFFVCLIKSKIKSNCFSNKKAYYNFLLEELKQFEKFFGEYVNNLSKIRCSEDSSCFYDDLSFSDYSETTVKKLCSIQNIKSIDSFNYTKIRIKDLEKLVYNINGNYENPIFGIDSSEFNSEDPRVIFCKTSRRLENFMIENKTPIFRHFKNIIIYGHSLNKADYNYFFSLLDKINIIDLNSQSKIIFAFTNFDEARYEEHKQELRDGIYKLFECYSKYRGNTTEPNRLLDALTTQNKVIMYEIEHLQ